MLQFLKPQKFLQRYSFPVNDSAKFLSIICPVCSIDSSKGFKDLVIFTLVANKIGNACRNLKPHFPYRLLHLTFLFYCLWCVRFLFSFIKVEDKENICIPAFTTVRLQASGVFVLEDQGPLTVQCWFPSKPCLTVHSD